MTDPQPIANEADIGGHLRDRLHEALSRVNPTDVRIATAYFTPDGFEALQDGLSTARSVQVLLGERPFVSRRGPGDRLAQPSDDDDHGGPKEEVDWYGFLEGDYPWILLPYHQRRELLLANEVPEELQRTFNINSWNKVQRLVRFLQRDEVGVRRYLAGKEVPPGQVLSHETTSRIRLHAKSYVMRGESLGYAAVGSSNLTKGGLDDNIELNLASYDSALVGQLETWFDRKWLEGQDCKDEFVRLLEECVLFGRRHTPWQVFLKAMHAAYGRYLDLALGEDVAARLAEFQQEAVSRCVTLLDRHWGAMLCDSVGLGKTFEGLGILAEFIRRRQETSQKTLRALVICPAQLSDNWARERLISNGIVGDTETMESLPGLILDEGDTETLAQQQARTRRLRRLQSYDIVLVDESHNFRNPATKRYRALMEIVRGGVADKRVVLLTATPINNTPWDLYHQLSLITRGDDTWYAGRSPITNLRSAFRAIEQGGGGTGLLDTMLLSLVRRTRHDIRAMQDAGQSMEVGGQALRFPQHEIPEAVTYSLEALYAGIYQEVTSTIDGLSFAVYDLESYGVRPYDQVDTEERLKQRNRNFIGIMRTILLKRMESSVVALMATVRTMLDYHQLFLETLRRDRLVLTPRNAQRLRTVLGGSLPDDVREASDVDERVRHAVGDMAAAPADESENERLVSAVSGDRDLLGRLLQRLEATRERWEEGFDPKVAALRQVLASLPEHDMHGVPTKVVVFTNYRDTAFHIFQSLGGPREWQTGAPVRVPSNLPRAPWLSVLTGTDNQRRRQEVLQHFAPLAFTRESEPPDDPELLDRIAPLRAEGIDLLVATDVLSEGQNLQDAQYLINYDLHWNPVRMIQRAGRIDRLFSPHEKVYFYNLMPEQGLETLLGLVKRLADRVASIEDMVGLDASVLGEQIEAKAFDQLMKLKAGGEAADAIYLEGERTQGLEAAFTELQRYIDVVKDIGTEEVREVPDGVHSIRVGDADGVFLLLRLPEEASGQVYWRFYPLEVLQPLTAPGVVLPLIEANRETQREELGDYHNPFEHLEAPLRAAIEQLAEEYRAQLADQSQDEFTRRLAQQLARDDLMHAAPDLWAKFQRWRQQMPPLDTLDRPRVRDWRRAVRQLRVNADLDELVRVLQSLWTGIEAEGLDRPIPKPASREPSVRDLQLVCWELVLTPATLAAITAAASPPSPPDVGTA